MEAAKPYYRCRDLQQFFTSLTNRNGTLYYEHGFTGAVKRGWARADYSVAASFPAVMVWERTAIGDCPQGAALWGNRTQGKVLNLYSTQTSD